MIRIVVLSDTHIPEKAKSIPEEILPELKTADIIIHAGDLVALNVLEQLRRISPRVYAVYGNMDPYEVRKELPEKEVIKVGKYKLGLMHGYGAPNNLIEVMQKAFKDEDVDIIIFGHSHAPFNEKRGKILFFNPGSITDKIFSAYNSYGILEINDKIEARIVKI